MKLLLHIGTEKTGTTTIQQFVWRNRALLREQNILVPESLGRPDQSILPEIFVETPADYFRQRNLLTLDAQRAAQRQWRQDFIRELDAVSAPTMLASSEFLQSHLVQDGEVAALRDFLKDYFDEVTIICYLRDPVATAVSLLSTAVKWGSIHRALPPPASPYFHNICNHQTTAERWSRAFGRDNLALRLFEPGGFVGGDLVADFRGACGIADDPRFVAVASANESLDALGIALLTRINAQIPRFLKNGAPNPAREGLIERFEHLFANGAKFAPDPADVAAYQSAFAASNEWIRRNFFPEKTLLFAQARYPKRNADLPDDADLDRLGRLIADTLNQVK